MRNIFDQYSQPENRLTHALVSSLGADPALLRRFIRWVLGKVPPSRNLEIIEQRLPGEEDGDEKEAERRGLPDAWIHDGGSWALILEDKIEAPLRANQLARHRRTAERRGFEDIHLVAIVTNRPRRPVPDGFKIIEWTELYAWLRSERSREWARRLTDYMEVLERKLADEEKLREGTLTVFAGIPFGKGHPYNYKEAKRLLRLALDELRTRRELSRRLRMDPQGKGRPAITGREEASSWGVWDFIPLVYARGKANFTKCPHLTLSIQYDRIFACVTFPNGLEGQYRKNLLQGGRQRFLQDFEDVCGNLESILRKVDGFTPWIEIVQRRYLSQRSNPIIDAKLGFNMRTAVHTGRRRREKGVVKSQPQWLETVYDTLARKKSNLQLTVGVIFPYSRCESTQKHEILDHIKHVWLGCEPLIRRALGHET